MSANLTHDTWIFNVLIIGDSRLRYLEPFINKTSLNVIFTVKMLPGARISSIIHNAKTKLSRRHNFNLVLIIGGINDMSKLVYSPSKHALPRYGNMAELIDQTLETIRLSMYDLRASINVPAVLSTIAGMEFSKYSPDYADLLCSIQRDFNQAVIQVNHRIRGINRLANLNTLNLAYPVHRCKGRRGRYTTQYSFLFDGLHPSEDLLERWAQSILNFCGVYFAGLTHV